MTTQLLTDGTRSLATAPSPNRRLDIQGLRAVAVLMVVAFHAGLPIPGGFVGVDVFFVISGFVITAMLQREWQSTGRIRLGRFYVRRFKRLTPALALMITITMVGTALILSPLGPQQNAAKTAIGAMLLSANIVIARTTGGYFDLEAETNPLLHTWSLSVEEQFYLVFPLVLIVGWILARRPRGRRSRAIPVALVAAAGLVSLGLALLQAVGAGPSLIPDSLAGFYGPITRAWEFAAGAILVLVGSRWGQASRLVSSAIAILGAGLLAVSLVVINEWTPFPGPATPLPVIGTLLVLHAGGHAGNVVGRGLSDRRMVTLGDLSYSWYLWHWPLIVFASVLWPANPVALLGAAAFSLLPAAASFRWIEQPLRVRPTPSRSALVRLVAVTVAPPLALAGAVGSAASTHYGNENIRHAVDDLASHADVAAGCDNPTPADQRTEGCVWRAGSTGTPVYLVGDSHAGHFSEAVIGAAPDSPVAIHTRSSCPFVDVRYHRDGQGLGADCRAFYEGTLRWLQAQPPGVVILAASDYYWLQSEFSVGREWDALEDRPEQKVAVLGDGLRSTIEALESAGHRVIVVQTVPQFRDAYSWDPSRCTPAEIAGDQCVRDMPVDAALEQQGAVRTAIARVAAETGADVVDVWDRLCAQGVCSTSAGDGMAYRDLSHISVPTSEALSGEFARAIAGVSD